jgi:hypothetical protein
MQDVTYVYGTFGREIARYAGHAWCVYMALANL